MRDLQSPAPNPPSDIPYPESIAFVAPRFPEGSTVGGAETLLKALASRLTANGHKVSFLTTCARNHFTWANEVEPGTREIDGVNVTFFPVDSDRDIDLFLSIQESICRRRDISEEEELIWLRNNVNSRALCDHLRQNSGQYDRIIVGPYLFGLSYFAAAVVPSKTILVPCLHDEPFAYLQSFGKMFKSASAIMFNSAAEQALASRIYGIESVQASVVGMGMEPFAVDKTACAKKLGLDAPYIIYSGRREELKGTPLMLDYLAAFRSRTGRDLKLVLTGTGDYELPASLRGHVVDMGFVSEKEKHDAMAGALSFCHPSVNESFGIVILESWLADRPVLVHGCSNVLKDHCEQSNGGLWFSVYPEFEEELCFLMDNPEHSAAMGKAGREYVIREYGWEAIDRKLLAALS